MIYLRPSGLPRSARLRICKRGIGAIDADARRNDRGANVGWDPYVFIRQHCESMATQQHYSASEERPEHQRGNDGKRQTYPKNVLHMTRLDALRGFNV